MTVLNSFRRDDDQLVVTLTDGELNALREVFGQVTGLINHGSVREDPALARLFPDGYADDKAAADELRRLTEGSLRNTKVANARELLATLPGGAKAESGDAKGRLKVDGGDVRLSEDQAHAWLTTLTDARLILGARLELAEDASLDDELDEATAENPLGQRVFAISVYQYLTFLQESLIQALTNVGGPAHED